MKLIKPSNLRRAARLLATALVASLAIFVPAATAQAAPASVSTAAASCTSTTLRQGDHGACVTQLQKQLKAAGSSITVDGSFGPKTTSVVKTFQKSKGLKVNGVVGPQTWGALIIATRAPPKPVPTSCSKVTLRTGSSGKCVTELQNRLMRVSFTVGRFSSDGDFGSGTRKGVMEYQKFYGLKVDGVVGPQTWKHLVAHPSAPASRLKHLSGIKNYAGVNIVADKSDKKAYIFKDGLLQRAMEVRFGGEGVNKDGKKYKKDTPTGMFRVQAKIINGYSNRYGVPMPYFVVFNGNIGFHESADFMYRGYGKNGKGGSHGCIGLSRFDAVIVFNATVEPRGRTLGSLIAVQA